LGGNHAVCEIMWKNTVEPGTPQMKIWRMRFPCPVTKATHTHSQYLMLIDFPLQQWSHERAAVLRYAYIACLVKHSFLPQRGACFTTGSLRMTFCICTDPKDFGWHRTLPRLGLRLRKASTSRPHTPLWRRDYSVRLLKTSTS